MIRWWRDRQQRLRYEAYQQWLRDFDAQYPQRTRIYR